MATKLLTAREVAPIETDGRHSIGDGLYLEVVGDARRWFTRYTTRERRREMQLGSAADVSLKEARELVANVGKTAKAGIDPIERKNVEEVEEAETPSFGTFADELIGTIASGFRNEKHIYQWKQTLGEAYCTSIRKKAVDAVTTEDVVEILKPLWATKQETASRLRGRIEKVLDAAKARGWRMGENPARWRGHLDHLLPRRQKLQRGHQPAMPYEEVPAFVGRLRGRDAVAARALEFLALTAARSGEVTGATWGEINLASKVWTVPAGRMKAGREHRVPLSTRAIEILNEAAKLCENEEPTAYLLTLIASSDGRAGLRELWSRLRHWRLGAGWYTVALLTAPLLMLAILLPLTALASPAFTPGFQWRLVAVGLLAATFEEIGWTGFATPRLLAGHRPGPTGLSLGLVWAFWHLLVDFRYNGTTLGAGWPLEFAIVYLATLTPYRVLMTWVFANTNSLPAAVLMHAGFTGSLMVLYPAATFAQALVWQSAFAAALWIAAVVVLRLGAPDGLTAAPVGRDGSTGDGDRAPDSLGGRRGPP